MKKLTLLMAAGALWLFLAAVPAFADGGPHTSSINNGVTSLTADSCAGCHRVHTAKGPMLINQATEEDLCLACHGDGLGATTDVLTGVQYVPAGIAGELPRSATELGALRSGGFEAARIGEPFRATIGTSRLGKVTVASVSEPVNSAHMPGLAGLTQPGIAWGNGANGSGAGPKADVSCGSCHNPHGNGQYRILNTIPGATGIDATWGGGNPPKALVNVAGSGTATADSAAVFNIAAHGFAVNNRVVVAGNALAEANGTFYVNSIVDNGAVTLKTSPTGTPVLVKLAAGTHVGGTVTLKGAALFNFDYTAAVPADPTATPPVTGSAATYIYKTVSSHGLLTGDNVTVTGNAEPLANVTGTVTVLNDTTFTIAGVEVTADGLGGMVIRNGGVKITDAALPGALDARNYTVIQTAYNVNPANMTLLASQAAAYSVTAGDYFHYRVPWNAATGSNFDAPNGIPGGGTKVAAFNGGFSEQMTMWCSQCHSRYYARSQPTEITTDADGTTGAAYENLRPGDDIFKYQHRTNANSSNRGCTTCHVSHGSNAAMTGEYSANFTFPNGTASNNSRLLKVDNRGTCQQCHEPTGTTVAGDQFPVTAPFQKVAIASTDATSDEFTTTAAHGLTVGDQVNIAANVGADGKTTINRQGVVASKTDTTFTIFNAGASGTAYDIATSGTGGFVGKMPATP